MSRLKKEGEVYGRHGFDGLSNVSGLEKITMVVVTDNHYLLMLAGLIKSIEDHLEESILLEVWVVDDGLTASNRKKLERSINRDITMLNWKKAKDILPKGVILPMDSSSWPLNIFYRLFIPNFLVSEVKRVLFMDVDIINCRSLRELWNSDLGDNIIGAVQDPDVRTFANNWGGIFNYRELGFDAGTKYFNSGVLLMDLEKWRENRITQKTLDSIHRYGRYAKYPDQYGLNITLANKWKELHPAWNHFACYGQCDPYNIHFTERKPIYKSYKNDPDYYTRFYHYLGKTEWKNFRPIGEPARYLKKLWNVIEKVKTLRLGI